MKKILYRVSIKFLLGKQVPEKRSIIPRFSKSLYVSNLMKRGIVIMIVYCGSINLAFAHQPVMDMAPRWNNGKGFQVRHEYRFSDKLIDKSDKTANPLGLSRKVNTTWLEGVYTFDRSKRVTIKIPWINQERITSVGSIATKQKTSGLGDIIIGIPLKKYSNFKDSTSNLGFTPSLRIPSAKTNGDYPTGDGSVDVGLSVAYSHEAFYFYQFYDLFYWINNEGVRGQHEGNQLGFDANLGIHPYHNNETNTGIFLMMDFSARYKDEGTKISGNNAGTRISLGPVFVFYHENMMFRAEYKIPVYELALDIQVAYGNEINVGVGFTF